MSNSLPTTWNLTPLATSDTDPALAKNLADVTNAAQQFVETWEKRTDYLEEPAILAQALENYELLNRNFGLSGSAGYYFDLRSDQESANPTLKAKVNQAEEQAIKTLNTLQFFELRLGTISPEKRALFLNDANLLPYQHFLSRLFVLASHQLSEAEERIDNIKSQGAYGSWVQMMNGILAKQTRTLPGEDGAIADRTIAEITSLLSCRNKPVRDAAAGGLTAILLATADIAEAELNAVLSYRKIEDELRGYSRPESYRHLNDDISSQTVDAMVGAVESRFDLPARFYGLKAKLLGQGELAYHERNVPFGNLSTEYPYAEALELVTRVLGKLDPEFSTILTDFSTQGLLDVYPAAGKRGGACCHSGLHTLPPYILLNHNNKLQDVLTLAHEVGHGINNVLTTQHQHALHGGTPLSTAEVASTFMEDFVLQELLITATPEERLTIQMIKLGDDMSTIFRQVAMYHFEQELHAAFRAEGYQSTEQIGALYQKHMQSYMGEFVTQDAGTEHWWIYINHFRSPFYVYSYASGLLIAKALQKRVLEDSTHIAEVKQFLSAGTSASPEAIFAKAGIEIANPAFWISGLEEIEALLNDTEELAISLGHI